MSNKKRKTTQVKRVYVVETLDDDTNNWYPCYVEPTRSGALYEARVQRETYRKTRIRKFIAAPTK